VIEREGNFSIMGTIFCTQSKHNICIYLPQQFDSRVCMIAVSESLLFIV
jgi:hypothetical protein